MTTKVVIKMKDGNFINIKANRIELYKDSLLIYNDDQLVAMIKVKEITSCHISEQKKVRED